MYGSTRQDNIRNDNVKRELGLCLCPIVEKMLKMPIVEKMLKIGLGGLGI